MTDDELQAIWERWEATCDESVTHYDTAEFLHHVHGDVAKLLAEVERLRARMCTARSIVGDMSPENIRHSVACLNAVLDR